MASINVSFPSHSTPDGADCEVEEIEVELGWEPGDPNYGADADGNRGISVPGYAFVEDELPTECPDCGVKFTAEQMADFDKRAAKQADEYEEDYEPDYDPMDDSGAAYERRIADEYPYM